MPDPADRMMNELERWAVLLLKVTVVCLLLIAYLLAIAWWLSPEPVAFGGAGDRTAFETDAEEIEFNRLLNKHGLQYDVSVIFEGRRGDYFFRNGQRCSFK